MVCFFCLLPGTASAFLWFGEKKEQPAEIAVTSQSKTLSLRQAYELALKRSETVAIGRSEIEEANGRYYQALSVVLPDVRFLMTRFDQDAISSSYSGSENASTSAMRRSTPLKKFTFHQPLFSGFKEIAALSAGSADKKSQEWRYQRAREVLWLDVSDSFYALLQAKQDVSILTEARQIMDKRIAELKDRVQLGRSRNSEVQMSIADENLIDARLAGARRVEIVARELFEFYIGRTLTEELLDTLELSREKSDSIYYLTLSARRSDVLAAGQDYVMAQQKVIVAQSGFFPSIYIDGNFYTQRTGFQSGTDWDTTLTFDVPIFDGALTIGEVRVSASQRDQARLKLDQARRSAALETQQIYDSYMAGLDEETAFRQARDASKESYRLQAEDYKLNAVNNLEVLDSLRRYQDIYRDWNASYYESKRNYWALRVAAGEVERKS